MTGASTLQAPFRTAIVGGGPAGLAPLVAASRDGRLEEFLGSGIVIIESGPAIGSGRIGCYGISSDSTAETFLTAVTGHADPRLGALIDHPLCREIRSYGKGSIPLEMAGALMALIGGVLHRAIIEAGGRVFVNHEALAARRCSQGRWHTQIRCRTRGTISEVISDTLVLATGGSQEPDRLFTELVAGVPLLPRFASKLLQSDDVLRTGGIAHIADRLKGRAEPRIAIVGGSTSAMATAVLLLRDLAEETSRPGSITLLHRRPLRVFYPSVQAAIADDYNEFGPRDICPVSGFVFRLAGFRTESRELLMNVKQIGGRPGDRRVTLKKLERERYSEARDIMAKADVIIAALGYRPKLLPLYDMSGSAISLMGITCSAPAVNEDCSVLDADGRPVAGVFGIGLAAGFNPRKEFGGEPSFVGQANGLWLWQTAVGSMLVDHLLTNHQDEPVFMVQADGTIAGRPLTALISSQEYTQPIAVGR